MGALLSCHQYVPSFLKKSVTKNCFETESKDLKTPQVVFQSPAEPENINMVPTPPSPAEKQRIAFFEKYAIELEEDSKMVINAEGIERLCEDLRITTDDQRILMWFWKCNVATMGYITQEEFCTGARVLGIEDIDGLRGVINSRFSQDLKKDDQLRPFYNYCFELMLEDKETNKMLEKEAAAETIQVILGTRFPFFVDKFTTFLEQNNQLKGLTKDQWSQFFYFCSTTSQDLSNYSDHFPSLIDDFVDWMKGKSSPTDNVSDEEED